MMEHDFVVRAVKTFDPAKKYWGFPCRLMSE